ncbi:hypothetical protein CQW23_26633 [Capsicum baccatum]|uniref:NB-ARC domain-containing protein n=1 Tax=Capsicum baccatum TaxID=33114 RepID=A0A2G2VPF0_CAPBA|nr:hypothetical protein CQW23_26633 [Capsicum baccatum]
MERLKNEEDQNAVDVYLIERLRLELAFICTYVQLSYSDLEQFEVVMSYSRQRVDNLLRPILNDVHSNAGCQYSMDHVLPNLMGNIDDCISSCYRSTSSATMTDEQLNFLLLNLHHLSKYLAERIFPLEIHHEILQNVSGNMKDFHGLIVNGCIEHEIVQYVLPQFQFMAERVGLFLWHYRLDGDSRLFKLAHLLMKIIPIELEMMQICYTNLKASPSAEIERFINQLLETSPEVLREYLIHLQEHMVTVITEDLEFIRSFFGNVEQGLYKDLWAHALDVAYGAKDVINSIIVRDNGLLHLIFSLPITIKKISLIKEDVSNLLEKIPKNKSLVVVNAPKNPLERKSLTSGKIIVGFKEETNWLITKLTSGPKDLDVISITGMPGSGKTTLAYKVYNDKSVCSHFDLRALCTVDQEYDEKNLLVKLFNQVTGSDLKFSEDIDVADKLRRQLFGKRYLIVLDDVWDTTVCDDLTRPFPEVEKGSRILLTTRQKEVALHGKRNTDPLKLRLLKLEESWELLEKRAFGNESCPDELLEVGKEIAQNCKGLPLVVDLIAGVIAGLEKTKSVWLEV